MFQHFGQRLKRDLKQLVDHRLEASAISSGSVQKVGALQHDQPSDSSYYDSRPALTSMSFPTNARGMQYGSVVLYSPLW
jgi:hypothetical protein